MQCRSRETSSPAIFPELQSTLKLTTQYHKIIPVQPRGGVPVHARISQNSTKSAPPVWIFCAGRRGTGRANPARVAVWGEPRSPRRRSVQTTHHAAKNTTGHAPLQSRALRRHGSDPPRAPFRGRLAPADQIKTPPLWLRLRTPCERRLC